MTGKAVRNVIIRWAFVDASVASLWGAERRWRAWRARGEARKREPAPDALVADAEHPCCPETIRPWANQQRAGAQHGVHVVPRHSLLFSMCSLVSSSASVSPLLAVVASHVWRVSPALVFVPAHSKLCPSALLAQQPRCDGCRAGFANAGRSWARGRVAPVVARVRGVRARVRQRRVGRTGGADGVGVCGRLS